jgi:chorismate dehydratase
VQYVDAVPAQCADLLAAREVDFALVPIIEYQRLQNVKLVSRACVASYEKVRSVLLVSRLNNLKKIRSIALDQSSRTSATLAKIIFREYLENEPGWSTTMPDLKQMLRENDAALIIGDPAMTFDRANLHVWDMASLWHSFTGKGFVFAMWMAGDDSASVVSSVDFEAARTEGLQAIESIVDIYTGALGLSPDQIREYLTHNITFELNEQLEGGMHLYFELAHKHGLIEELRPADFLEQQNVAAGLD